jgi:hypothetical protein
MRIALFGAVGLVVGLGMGTGLAASRERASLMAEMLARRDSLESVARAEAAGSELSTEDQVGRAGDSEPDGSVEGEGAELALPGGEDTAEDEEAGVLSSEVQGDSAGDVAARAMAGEEDAFPGTAEEGSALSPATEGDGADVSGETSSSPTETQGQGPERLAKIFAAMKPDEAAAVLQQLRDGEVQSILRHMSDRRVAQILSHFEPQRAASLSRVVMGSNPGGIS